MRWFGTTNSPLGQDFHLLGAGPEDTFRAIIAIIQRYRTNTGLGRLALRIIREVPEKDSWGEARAVFEWLRKWKYVKDPHGRELLHTPPRLVKQLGP